jgi:putative resolvase
MMAYVNWCAPEYVEKLGSGWKDKNHAHARRGSSIEYLKTRFPTHERIEDIGRGLNFKRKGLNALLELVMSGHVSEIVIAHRDRLCRFGYELIEAIATKNSCKIMVLDESQLSPQAELVNDLLSIIHVFSCRLYGLRKCSRKIKEDTDLPQKQTVGS